jgi:hypothetical protein
MGYRVVTHHHWAKVQRMGISKMHRIDIAQKITRLPQWAQDYIQSQARIIASREETIAQLSNSFLNSLEIVFDTERKL